MSDALATYSFLSWLREGVGTAIAPAQPPSTDVPGRAAVNVAFDVNGDHVDVGLHLYGPGDVVGIDPRLVVRTVPHHQSTDFEPNYFPAIEFAPPGLPWLFTPLPAAGEQLLPWICLVVVRKQDGVAFEAADAKRPLTVLRIDAPARPLDELPDLGESWAWAHGHVSWSSSDINDGDAVRAELARLLRESPGQSVSRLVCPRILKAGEQYYACVVPVFDAGLKAGLGELAPGDDGLATLDFAWKSETPPTLPFRLPVYYHWEFTAGSAGDFESLVRRITARRELPGVGQRPMDVSDPGPTDLEMPGVVLGLEGALQPPGMHPTPWPNETAHTEFQTELAKILDASATAVPVVAPPLYGQFPAGRDTVPADGWLRELNLDPRNRAAAAFGTTVVQEQQEQLMASAWAQLGELRKLNQVLQRAQLARSVTAAAHDKHLRTLRPAPLIAVSRPVLTRIGTPDPSIRDVSALRAGMGNAPPRTFYRVLADSTITAGALSPAFQQIARPGGPLARRLFAPGEPVRASVVERLNAKQIVAASPRAAPDGTVAMDAFTAGLGDKYERVRYEAATSDTLSLDPG